MARTRHYADRCTQYHRHERQLTPSMVMPDLAAAAAPWRHSPSARSQRIPVATNAAGAGLIVVYLGHLLAYFDLIITGD